MEKDVTATEQLSTGLETVPTSDSRKAPQTVQLGKRAMEGVMERTLLCDVFCGYSEESGNARFDQTLMRDIIAYYKLGHVVHASAATHRGKPIPIGQSAASAKTSDYDEERLKRLEVTLAAQKKHKEAEATLAARESSAAGSSSTVAPASVDGPPSASDEKVLKKRATAGVKKPTAVPVDSTFTETTAMDTDRRGKLTLMRLLLKWSDGCGVQYVQREAALGTASLYGDIEELARQAATEVLALGVIGLHVVFEPHCFKGIHDAAGKVFVDSKNKAVLGRAWTISDIEQHYDYNAAMMLTPKKREVPIR